MRRRAADRAPRQPLRESGGALGAGAPRSRARRHRAASEADDPDWAGRAHLLATHGSAQAGWDADEGLYVAAEPGVALGDVAQDNQNDENAASALRQISSPSEG